MYKINDIEFDCSFSFAIAYSKVKPLRIATWISIVMHYQVVLVLGYL